MIKYLIKKINHQFNFDSLFDLLVKQKNISILDSSMEDDEIGLYSIFTYNPFMKFKSYGDLNIIINDKGKFTVKGNPIDTLQTYLDKYHCDIVDIKLPFISGCIGYFSYDLCEFIEKLPHKKDIQTNIPDIFFSFYDKAIIYDHKKKEIILTASNINDLNNDNLDQKIAEMYSIIKKCIYDNKKDEKTIKFKIENVKQYIKYSNFSKLAYMDSVLKAKEYIRDGDIYQVNLSQKFKIKVKKEPEYIYKKLRIINSAPFSAYIDCDDFKILSSSPERFIKINKSIIETRPIKGTIRRGDTVDEDKILSKQLIHSKKDKAELTMIIDLERNDLGRVCKIGSVHVKRAFKIEYYKSVIHLVSIIIGNLKKGIQIKNIIKAAFPGGSITGAPKISAMKVINELEPDSRNIYTGSIGYIDISGNCDLNIAIRTLIYNDSTITFNVGGGIVADSDPETEYYETLYKGNAILQTIDNL